MHALHIRRFRPVLLAILLTGSTAAGAQQLFDRVFGNNEPRRGEVTAQLSSSDLLVRLDRLESHIRQLTGNVEQLQFRNQQLEQQLKRMQEDTEFRFQEMGGRGGQRPPSAARPAPPAPAPAAQPPGRRSDLPETGDGPAMAGSVPAPVGPAQGRGRRGDAFDPDENPGAPGAPRTLGAAPVIANPEPGERHAAFPAGGRDVPLDLGTLAENAARDPALGDPGNAAPVRGQGGAGTRVAAVQPPSATPKDEYDLGYGYVLRKDFAQAEETFRSFLQNYPGDRLAPDAHYWLGESLFQRQRYRDAAESFLTVTTKYATAGKAPDSLLRLGQSLAALDEKEAGCAALAEVGRKYPRASVGVKQAVDREQKRVRC